jgi:hypothetical protein
MKTIRISMALLALSLTALFSCSKSDLTKPQSQSINSSSSSNVEGRICGEPFVYDLIDHQSLTVVGKLSISNDENNVLITITPTNPDFKISKAALVIGSLAHVTAATDLTAWPKFNQGPNPADFTQSFKPQVSSYTFTIASANYDDCFFVNACAKFVKRDAITHKVIDASSAILQSETKTSKKCWSAYVEYCKQNCPPPGECGQLTTFTQGGYGNDRGNGAGTSYMVANFAAAFPNGITIGCAGDNTVKMTSAAAIQAFLPTGTTPSTLTGSFGDGATPDNVLIGQVLTLALSVGFDNHDPNFGSATIHLEDMIIGGSGPFAGKTVKQFLQIANDVLGGCSNAFTPSQVNDQADEINNNYDDGTQDNGHLICPNE